MDANQVNLVINNICEKIGIGIDGLKDFVPMLAKYEIINCIFWFLFGVVLLVVGFLLFKKARTAYKEASSWEKDGPGFAIGATGILMLVGFCSATASIFNIVQWCITPEAKTVIYILKMISPK